MLSLLPTENKVTSVLPKVQYFYPFSTAVVDNSQTGFYFLAQYCEVVKVSSFVETKFNINQPSLQTSQMQNEEILSRWNQTGNIKCSNRIACSMVNRDRLQFQLFFFHWFKCAWPYFYRISIQISFLLLLNHTVGDNIPRELDLTAQI